MGLDQLLYIGFGWLLGLLAPAIVERIRKNYRRADLTVAIKAELHEFQYKMALLCHDLNSRLGTLTDAHLTWFEQIVKITPGRIQNREFSMPSGYRSVPEQARCQALADLRNPRVGIGLLQYSLPLVTAHLSDILLYPVPFQSAVIRIKDQLDMFNQRVTNLQNLHEKTFDASLSESNRLIVISEAEKGYRHLAKQSAFIVDAISALPAAG